ncbi:PREDICTED: axin-like [Vollenhovia emeryi]|uniref:axin-like n=1 Tax=Vollenhovia emeryi TaxID=411798 RepID=UPI0005F48AAB|nr:PREDICTED: axin-like [Vollenhovia emeryi]
MDSTMDSGNIYNFEEGSDLVGAGSMSHVQGHDQKFRRSDTRRSATKKSTTNSGVSVVSNVQPSANKDVRLLPNRETTSMGVPAQPFVADPGIRSPRWARNFQSLLGDPTGLELFKRYLSQEGHLDPLNFWFACEGLKKQKDMDKISRLVKIIYRQFFLKSPLSVPEDIMKEVDRRVKEGRTDHKVFDIAQLEVEQLINKTMYPKFLQSDVYVQYVQTRQNADSSGCPSSSSGSRKMSISCGPSLLPTVHEDSKYIGKG